MRQFRLVGEDAQMKADLMADGIQKTRHRYLCSSEYPPAISGAGQKAEMGAAKTEIHGDQITKTKIKDSVVSKSNIGAGGKSSKAEELREAKALLDEGLINEDDYEKMKKEILGK